VGAFVPFPPLMLIPSLPSFPLTTIEAPFVPSVPLIATASLPSLPDIDIPFSPNVILDLPFDTVSILFKFFSL
ncbi:hypothetical protein, partial [Pseudostreptobacillus hongkongensis]|uniref:hypothetical protein n=1 Tax=Pseudostreptobacillus hongkongensis TaxID=1162717 RepID=UPI0014701457